MNPAVSTSSDLRAIKAQLSHSRLTVSTFNFVVWIDEPSIRGWVLARAEQIGEKHPSRTIVFDTDPRRRGSAMVMTSARDAGAHFTVQSERVEIGVGTGDCGTLCDTLEQLRGANLPTVLWWTGDRTDEHGCFDAILRCGVDAVVVDSSGLVAGRETIGDVVRVARAHPRLALRDLAWMRLRPWHDLIARFFDDPELIRELYDVRRLRIVSGSDAEALYLGGWLASRLGWTASGVDAFRDRAGRAIPFEHARSGEKRRVRHVTLETGGSSYHGKVRDDDERVVEVWVEGEHAAPPRMVPLAAVDNASLIERAILESTADPAFLTALAAVRTLLRAA